MKTRVYRSLLVVVGAALLVGCGAPPPVTSTVAPPTASPSPEPTKPKPTATATSIPTPQELPTVAPTSTPAATATSAPTLPPSFDMVLDFTNSSCGYPDAQFPYTFSIDGNTLTLLQVDASITTVGAYDPATGAFNTSGAVGPGTETYEGTIGFDGQTITVAGTSTYTQAGQCTSVSDIFGETSAP